jgi:hypothetical protein
MSKKPPALPKLAPPDGKSTDKTTGRSQASHRSGKSQSSHRGDLPLGQHSDRKQSGPLSHRDKSARTDKPKAKAKASQLSHRDSMSSIAEAPAPSSSSNLVEQGLEQPPSFHDEPPALEEALDELAAEEEGASSETV